MPFLKWNDPFCKQKVFICNMIRFRSAMKPTIMAIKHHISFQKRLVSLPIWKESYCKWKLSVSKTDRSISGIVTSCLFWNETFQNFFYQCCTKHIHNILRNLEHEILSFLTSFLWLTSFYVIFFFFFVSEWPLLFLLYFVHYRNAKINF